MTGPFRVKKPAALAGEGPPEAIKNWMDRLLKLVPTEVVALYLAGRGIIGPDDASGNELLALACLAFTVVVRVLGTRDNGKRPQVIAVAIAAVSFVIWVLAIGGPFPGLNLSQKAASLTVLFWTAGVPHFYRGD